MTEEKAPTSRSPRHERWPAASPESEELLGLDTLDSAEALASSETLDSSRLVRVDAHESNALASSETLASGTSAPELQDTAAGLPPIALGLRVDQFRVRRLLGRGGMGEVYLARDETLGRPVALKFVRQDKTAPERTQQFLEEARITARIAHPNVVTIHAVGLYGDRPYLALEYLDGESLADRLAADRFGRTDALRTTRDIARALAAAHTHGIVHRDLKPGNVMIPSDGRVRVLDFGLAALSGHIEYKSHGHTAGTPAYMAPEQWLGQPATSATDVWALGVVLAEMLLGRHPYLDGLSTPAMVGDRVLNGISLPTDALDERDAAIIRRCLTPDWLERPTAEAIADALEQSLLAQHSLADLQQSPYRGLDAFDETHAPLFRGRDSEISVLLERLRSQAIVPVVGPSGAGKSSLIRAGVLPRLRDRGHWKVLVVRPGERPLRSLAARLTGSASSITSLHATPLALSDHTDLETQLRRAPATLNLQLHRMADMTGSRVLLFVDQLEELWTQGIDETERLAFINAVVHAVDDDEDPAVRVMFSVREDFLGRVAQTEAGRLALNRITVLRPMTRAQLREAIVTPLAMVGYRFESEASVQRLLDETTDEHTPLPLLQFALRSLWDRRDKRRQLIPDDAVDAIDGVAGALVTHADAVVTGLPDESISAARRLLTGLVSIDGSRRIVAQAEAYQWIGPALEQVLPALTNGRLVTARKARDGSGEPVLELVHDALIQHWRRLRAWLDESSDERRLLDELETAADVWHRRERPDTEVWDRDAVRDARRRLETHSAIVSDQVDAFLAAGARMAERQQTRRRRALLAGGLLLTTIAIVATLAALKFRAQEQVAREQKAKIDKAAADLGLFTLDLGAYDWTPETLQATPVTVDALPRLRWSLARRRMDGTVEPYPAGTYSERVQRRDGRFHIDIEAPSGRAVLTIEGRGRNAECPASELTIAALPGYSTRDVPRTFRLDIPTCAASYANAAPIPAGEFVFGGAGIPPTPVASHIGPEEVVLLPAYAMDRTEVPNAAYARFSALTPLTGLRVPSYPRSGVLKHSGDPDHPVTSVTAEMAEAYCRFHGGTLPSSQEWEKAARGGLSLPGGQLNPSPKRNTPWSDQSKPLIDMANLSGDADGYRGTAPIVALADAASPYTLVQLVGNVREWTSTTGNGGLRIVRGGAWDTDPTRHEHLLAYENRRAEQFFSYACGFRCRYDPRGGR